MKNCDNCGEELMLLESNTSKMLACPNCGITEPLSALGKSLGVNK